MIGFFDSGFGGLMTMKYFHTFLPFYDYIFLADSKNVPYGTKSPEQIQELTFRNLHRLFDQGCQIVILACNTASTYSIRKRQTQFPNKKVLSVTIPGVESIIHHQSQNIVLMATEATIKSEFYEKKLNELNYQYQSITSISGQDFVNMIEKGENGSQNMIDKLAIIKQKIPKNIDTFILGCTHFSLMREYIQNILPPQVTIIDPSIQAANSFLDYLKRHPEIEKKLSNNHTTQCFTTGNIKKFKSIGETIWGGSLSCKKVSI